MSVDALRVRGCRRWTEELPANAWLGAHAGLYLVLSAAAVAWVGPFQFAGLLVILGWGGPVLALLTAGFGTFPGLLRVLADLPWYWFRSLALLSFVLPPALFLSPHTPMREVTAALVVQLSMASVLVQPRRHRVAPPPPAGADRG
ncbi:hypothetical protein GCM10010172_60710 [Paractinoplanes ferrugineus]|uniref:Uncharacterized protein n=1 Tax=Paractinoplanes ferrugineus TaxID=113564 RepID=A0A919JCF2_9ACTN|nr:hypothetical protein [Actinoplanes ferrugineus]GIE14601.1 hypothetical protein Afe05nite_64410 [Actinoplanes ferrugineus]